MKLLAAALAVCSVTGLAVAEDATFPQLKQVQSVYILPMSGGMDQYLANRITREGLFQVVTDPQRADAILTDRLGETLERRLDDLFPPPKPAKVDTADKNNDASGKTDKNKTDQDKADKDKNDKDATVEHSGDALANNPIAATAGTEHPASSFGRGKGTIFLVDRRSRAVLWSTYDRPHDMRPDSLDKTADQVMHRLKRDLRETKPAPAQ